MMRYPTEIMEKCRMQLDLEPDDTSKDDVINTYTPREAFEVCCEYEGIIGYADILLRWRDECFGTDEEVCLC